MSPLWSRGGSHCPPSSRVLELRESPSEVEPLGEKLARLPQGSPGLSFCHICRAVAEIQVSAARFPVSNFLPHIFAFTALSRGLWTSWCLAASWCIFLPLCLQPGVRRLILTLDRSRSCLRVIENTRIPC